MACFMIVGREEPLYELLLEPTLSRREDVARATQFILHGSLDLVDLQVWTNPATHLKLVDRHNDQFVSAYVTPSGTRFLLLHDGRSDDSIKAFFVDVHELFVKVCFSKQACFAHTRHGHAHLPLTQVLLNPLYSPDSRIESKEFDSKARALAKRTLGYRIDA